MKRPLARAQLTKCFLKLIKTDVELLKVKPAAKGLRPGKLLDPPKSLETIIEIGNFFFHLAKPPGSGYHKQAGLSDRV